MLAREQRLVQEFVPQASIEALDEGVLHGFARCDVMPVDPGVISPCQDGVAGEFAAIVADHHLRPAALNRQPVQFPRHTGAGDEVSATSARHSPVKAPSRLFRRSSKRP